MRSQTIAAGLIVVVGAIGSLASVYSIQDTANRNPVFAVCLLFTLIALYLFLSSYADIGNVISNLTTIKQLGIKRIYRDGSGANELVRASVKKAKSIRLITVSGDALIKMLKDELIYALEENTASVRVLLATPDSEFMKDLEETEHVDRIGHISSEVRKVDALLREYLSEAKSKSPEHAVIGKIALRQYTTHLRSSVLLCDNAWAWLTLNLPPVRAVQSPSFELSHTDKGLLMLSSRHFERIWDILMSRGTVREIAIQQGVPGDDPRL